MRNVVSLMPEKSSCAFVLVSNGDKHTLRSSQHSGTGFQHLQVTGGPDPQQIVRSVARSQLTRSSASMVLSREQSLGREYEGSRGWALSARTQCLGTVSWGWAIQVGEDPAVTASGVNDGEDIHARAAVGITRGSTS